ncbi:MAG: metallophosphoesterase [Thermoprotei archaeon]|nr:MAG: metallophosphoesterase [Thermoprotei archaeon]
MRQSINLAAVSDAHLPKYLDLFKSAVSAFDFSDVDLLILAGDMVFKGKIEEYGEVLSIIKSQYNGPIYAVFGNEEYQELEEEIRRKYPEILWLNDSYEQIEVKGARIGLVGSRGVLDKPTSWQAKHIPNITAVYAERLIRIRELLIKAKRENNYVILITHYAVICDTLKGEKPQIWRYLGSARLKTIIKKIRPTLVIHGHAHNSSVFSTRIESTYVYNVALPATKRVTRIEVKKIDLSLFF